MLVPLVHRLTYEQLMGREQKIHQDRELFLPAGEQNHIRTENYSFLRKKEARALEVEIQTHGAKTSF